MTGREPVPQHYPDRRSHHPGFCMVCLEPCPLCARPVPTGGALLLCEVERCANKPTAWYHDPAGVHWLACDDHATPSAADRQFRLAVQEHLATHPQPVEDCGVCSYLAAGDAAQPAPNGDSEPPA